MKELLGQASNLVMIPVITEEGQKTPQGMAEIILVVAEPKTILHEGKLVKTMDSVNYRFYTHSDGLRGMADTYYRLAEEIDVMEAAYAPPEDESDETPVPDKST